jgi:hypothetical protein
MHWTHSIEIKTVHTLPSILSLTPSSSSSSCFIRIHLKTMAVYDRTPPGDGATMRTTNTWDEGVTPRMMGTRQVLPRMTGTTAQAIPGMTETIPIPQAIPRMMGTTWMLPRTTGQQPVEGERSEMGMWACPHQYVV